MLNSAGVGCSGAGVGVNIMVGGGSGGAAGSGTSGGGGEDIAFLEKCLKDKTTLMPNELIDEQIDDHIAPLNLVSSENHN